MGGRCDTALRGILVHLSDAMRVRRMVMKSDKNWSKTKTLQVVVPYRREMQERNI